MAEKISSEIRSRMMSAIRGRNTRPEMTVRSFLHRNGLRFRLHKRELPGRPDVVLPRWGVAIFVHGCFWHGHKGCRYFRLPKTRAAFWKAKIDGNTQRDGIAVDRLTDVGWRVVTIWECALRDDPAVALKELLQFIESARSVAEIKSIAQ